MRSCTNLLVMEVLQREGSGKLITNHVSVHFSLALASNFPCIDYFSPKHLVTDLPLAEARYATMKDNWSDNLESPEAF